MENNLRITICHPLSLATCVPSRKTAQNSSCILCSRDEGKGKERWGFIYPLHVADFLPFETEVLISYCALKWDLNRMNIQTTLSVLFRRFHECC